MTQKVQLWNGGRRQTLIALGLVLALTYVGAAIFTDSTILVDALRRLGWLGCMAVLGLSMVNYLLRFLRWQYYLAKLGRELPVRRHLLCYLSGFAFTVSPAKAGEAVRALYLGDHGVTFTESIASLFVERFMDLLAIAALASLMVVDRPVYHPLLITTGIFLGLVLVCVCQPRVPVFLDRLSSHCGRRVAGVVSTLGALLRSSRRLLHPQPLLYGISIGLLAWAAEGLGFSIICDGLHIAGSISTFVGIYALAVLGGSAAFFLPAGIGGMEVVMTTLLVAQGAPLRVAIIATLLCRLATLWFAVILGVAAASAIELSKAQIGSRATP
jgi:glycosyltransferase 2 family protein